MQLSCNCWAPESERHTTHRFFYPSMSTKSKTTPGTDLQAKLAAARASEGIGSPARVVQMTAAADPAAAAPASPSPAGTNNLPRMALARPGIPAQAKPTGSSLERIRSRAAGGQVTRVPVEVTPEFLDLVGRRVASVLTGSRPPKPAELVALALVVTEEYFRPDADGSSVVTNQQVADVWRETIRRKSLRAADRRVSTLTGGMVLPAPAS